MDDELQQEALDIVRTLREGVVDIAPEVWDAMIFKTQVVGFGYLVLACFSVILPTVAFICCALCFRKSFVERKGSYDADYWQTGWFITGFVGTIIGVFIFTVVIYPALGVFVPEHVLINNLIEKVL